MKVTPQDATLHMILTAVDSKVKKLPVGEPMEWTLAAPLGVSIDGSVGLNLSGKQVSIQATASERLDESGRRFHTIHLIRRQ